MLRSGRFVGVSVALFALVGLSCGTTHAGTIIKLDLGDDASADIVFDGVTLSTSDDGNAATTGNQDTDVEFLDFLSGETDIVSPPPASFSMGGLTTAGLATVFGGVLVIQDFTGGSFDLYDASNGLLLSGTLGTSTLAGPLGPPATGALFTTSFATVAAGSLASQIDKDSLTLSMSLTDINGAAGLGLVVPPGRGIDILDDFVADATIGIAAEPVPEPVTVLLLVLGATLVGFSLSRRRC